MAMILFREIAAFTKEYPIIKGMVTYSVLWPSSNICQQLLQGREQINFAETARFSLFGTFFVAPSLFVWVKTAGKLFPGQSVKVAIKKALVEQVLYSPIAISGFYVGMSLLENRSWKESIDELKLKFAPTYKTGLCVWPALQTLNFAFVKERNRVLVTGVASFFWTVFLSYSKHLDRQKQEIAC